MTATVSKRTLIFGRRGSVVSFARFKILLKLQTIEIFLRWVQVVALEEVVVVVLLLLLVMPSTQCSGKQAGLQ